MVENKIFNLKNDVIFKAFFAKKGNEEFLIDFLEAILKIEIEKIEIREEVNLEKLKDEEKGGRLDLQATLNDGIIVNIELQIQDTDKMENRSLVYAAKTISRETKKGTKYQDINQVIMINILNYKLLPYKEYVSDTVTVLNKHREYEVIEGVKWYFIELPKFRKAKPDMDEKLNQWLALIDDRNRGWIEMAEKKNKTIERARVEMEYLTGDEELKRLAELREKWAMDYDSGISAAREKGIEIGRQEGRTDGIKIGMKTGQAKGEKKKQIEITKKLLKMNMKIADIVNIVGLEEKEILEIKEETNQEKDFDD